MKRLAVALCFAALSALPLLAAIQEPIKVEGGLVSGTPGWAWGVRAYLGIPFAAPPVGNRRWRPPQAVIPWQGVRAAREFSSACMQSEAGWTDEQLADPGLWHKSEDCLYLNVWTPATSASERLPVLVWIHAGAGIMGSTARPIYDGNALAKKGVVVVSANYRLGVFGWFAHPELTRESEHRSSGNYGALDQLAALQWVQKNIAQFGGDPNKVTMFGQSAGCGAVNWLAASPLAKGLVRGGIGQSFRTFHRMITLAEAENVGAQFAKAIGKPTLAALRAMPAQDLLEASVKTPAATATNAAIVDGWFLPQDIYTIYSQGKQNDIPLITGGTNDEGAVGALGDGSRNAPEHPRRLHGMGQADLRRQGGRSPQSLSGENRRRGRASLSRRLPRHQFRRASHLGQAPGNDGKVAGLPLQIQSHPSAPRAERHQSSGPGGGGALLRCPLRLQHPAHEGLRVDRH